MASYKPLLCSLKDDLEKVRPARRTRSDYLPLRPLFFVAEFRDQCRILEGIRSTRWTAILQTIALPTELPRRDLHFTRKLGSESNMCASNGVANHLRQLNGLGTFTLVPAETIAHTRLLGGPKPVLVPDHASSQGSQKRHHQGSTLHETGATSRAGSTELSSLLDRNRLAVRIQDRTISERAATGDRHVNETRGRPGAVPLLPGTPTITVTKLASSRAVADSSVSKRSSVALTMNC